MGFSLKKFVSSAVKAAAAPVLAPVKAVAAIANGENVLNSVVSGAVGTMAAINPVTQINTLTDGALANTLGKVPLVGGFLGTNVDLGTQISTQGGTIGDAAEYAAGQAAIGGAIAGGLALAPAIAGAGGTVATATSTVQGAVGAAGAAGAGIAALTGGSSGAQTQRAIASNGSSNEQDNSGAIIAIGGGLAIIALVFAVIKKRTR